MAEDRQQQLDRLVRLIVAEVGPLRVGCSDPPRGGESTETGDVNLLVVVPDGTPGRGTAMRIYGSVTDVTLTFDIVSGHSR